MRRTAPSAPEPLRRARVSVTLVTWNAACDVGPCLESVRVQTHPPTQVRVYDNASTDGTPDRVASGYPMIELHRNVRNVGYAAAQNQGRGPCQRRRCAPRAVLDSGRGAGPRTIWPGWWPCSRRIRARLQPAASCSGRTGHTLDSTGIVVSPERLFRDRGQGELDRGQYDDPAEPPPFAPCGAVVLHRLAALQDVAVGGEVVDESFFAYKEDIDLAWRLRMRGWRVCYVPEATAHHVRAAPYSGHEPGRPRSLRAIQQDRRCLSPRVRRLSARNQLLALVKNEHPRVLVSPDIFRIAARQLALLVYTSFLEPTTLPAYVGFLTHLPGALRRRLRFRRCVDHRTCRAWFHRPPPSYGTHFPNGTE